MDDYENLSHSNWACKYHVVFIPKCCRKTLCGECFSVAMQKQGRDGPSDARSMFI
jgi:REP element-mobilizing transposase RayT